MIALKACGNGTPLRASAAGWRAAGLCRGSWRIRYSVTNPPRIREIGRGAAEALEPARWRSRLSWWPSHVSGLPYLQNRFCQLRARPCVAVSDASTHGAGIGHGVDGAQRHPEGAAAGRPASPRSDPRPAPNLFNPAEGLSMEKPARASLRLPSKFVPLGQIRRVFETTSGTSRKPLNSRSYTLCEVQDGERQVENRGNPETLPQPPFMQ